MSNLLTSYESSGAYVFHGSHVGGIRKLQPRQSMSFGELDGPPAISASLYYEPALFMAILSRKPGCAMGINPSNKNPYGLVVPKSIWQEAKTDNWTGFVYVLNRKDFSSSPNKGWECRANTSISPVDAITVYFNNLQQNIKVIDDDKRDDYVNNFKI